ncbi:protein-tyrosine phosphatase-like protein [Podospora appendiculata]|uniref:protein-tyrosine-phosphatase n=1 Tax=Podospora appendiculata TaxID=314037 RepID=A0AAE1C7K7_9PEZI|nr:protein-tyrosine phosphatase-like protein [Podospora appendiculata]
MNARPTSNPPITEIEDGLYIGDIESSHRVEILKAHNISAMVSVTAGGLAYWRRAKNRQIVSEDRHLYVPAQDSKTHDLLPDLARICDFIDRNRSSSPEPGGGGVLIHCEMGVSRSATALIAYLMRTHQWSFDTALGFVKEKRKIRPNSNFKEQLVVWGEVGYEIWEDEENKVPKAPYAAFLERRAERLKALGLTGDEPVVPDL